MADVNKCQSKSSTSDKPRVKGKFVKKGTASRSNRLKYFNKVNYDLSKTRGTEHSYSREADDCYNYSQTADHDVYYDANIALVETVAEDSDISWRDGRRIVELKHMADQMFCVKCSHPLHLSHIVDEKISGLGSFLHIQCPSPQCLYINTVTTGKRNEKGVFDINNKATIAMIHSGMGPTHLQNFLAACNIPPPNQSTIIRREKEMSKSLLSQAKQSCDRARDKEKNSTESTSMEASFDAAWQTRGSGCQYNSNTGHSSMIGPNTDKVIDFDYRTRLCSICTHHFSRRETVPAHVCNSNWEGSSKAMESDMAASMLRRLKDDGFEISAIHADNDSTTAARLKAEFQSLEKRCDKNHLKKNITKQLYSLSKSHKQLKQEGVICYITKCYMHPLSIKRQSEEEVGRKLDMVVPHIFGDHNLCSTSWCAYHRNPKSYRMKYLPDGKPLNDEMLREALNRITLSLKRILPQLVCLGSTQSNENFNNMVASKAPKNRAYGRTTSLASRVSAAVLQKNEGYTYISQVNEDALLSPGVVSKLHGIRMDKKKLWNKKQQSSIAFKRRRLLLKKRKQKREYSLHLREGNTYGSNIETAAEVDIESIPGKLDPEKGECIMFDIETTGLSRDSDIVQLSAFDGITEFNVYIRPNQPISKNATAISGITFSFEKNTVYYNGREVESTDLRLGLLKFLEYLQSHANPILVGHNIMSYDIPVLCHKLHECSMLAEFIQCVYGCADTLKLAHKLYKKEDVGNYKQSNLVNILLGKSYAAHNSLEDVKILHELFTKKLTCHSEDLFPFHIHILQKSFKTMVEKKAMSVATSRKIAGSGLGFRHIMLAHKRDELSGVKTLLGEHGMKGKVVSKMIEYLKAHEE